MDIKDKIVLVTGASRGIGAGIADELVRQGARVFGTATSESGAQAISERLKGLEGAHAGAGLVLDVNDSGSIEQCLATIGEQAGPVAVLVNNAGITKDQLLLRLGEDDWDAVMDTNLRAIYRLSKAVLRGMMKARWGRIINIGSVVGTTGNPGQALSSAMAGMGCTVLPYPLAAEAIASGKLEVLEGPEESRRAYWLVAPLPQWRQKKVKALVAHLIS